MTYSKGDSGLSFSSHKPKSKVEKGLEASATASRAHAGTGLLKLSSIYRGAYICAMLVELSDCIQQGFGFLIKMPARSHNCFWLK